MNPLLELTYLMFGLYSPNPPAMQETQVRCLGQENPREKEMATHSSIFASLENPTDRGAWGAIVHGVAKSRTD